MNITHTYIPATWLLYTIGASLLLSILAFFYGRECRYCRAARKERQRAAVREECPFLSQDNPALMRARERRAAEADRVRMRLQELRDSFGVPSKSPVTGSDSKPPKE